MIFGLPLKSMFSPPFFPLSIVLPQFPPLCSSFPPPHPPCLPPYSLFPPPWSSRSSQLLYSNLGLICALIVIRNTLTCSSIPTFWVVTPNIIHRQMDIFISQWSPLRSIGIISRTSHLISYNLKKIHNLKSYTKTRIKTIKKCEGYDLQGRHMSKPFH